MEFEIKDKEYWNFLKKKIRDLGIFNCQNYSDSFLLRRIQSRLRRLNTFSFKDYSRIIEKSKEERAKLVKELAIHVTHFFRDVEVYDAIKNDVLPFMIKAKEEREEYKIKIWSTACSSGEEPYSIAILLKEFLGSKINNFNVDIIATDIDQVSIDKAKEGIYQEKQLEETKKEYIMKYFEKKNSKYHIKDGIKNMVYFKKGDLLAPNKPKNVDIIFCRNVVIYFDSDTKSRLYFDLFNCLNKEGFLVMGKTESILGPAREKLQIFNNRERIYCKE